jgi:cell wall-associated NlpC family hydrolase
MKARRFALMFLGAVLLAAAAYAGAPPTGDGQEEFSSGWQRIKSTIDGYLGRPYVWGAAGIKSFDCSGFVWRVLNENGILMKRTTARKLYFSLAAAAKGKELTPGNLVFFDNLRHCGIVNDSTTFYHAQTSIGTNLSNFQPYWRGLVVGYRCVPIEKR